MRKIAAVLLVAACAVAAGGQAVQAADRAGVGLEWSIGPALSLSGFDMKMGQQFALNWKVSESFAVGIWNGSGLYRGEKSYQDATTTTLKHKIVTSGTTGANGITLLATLPVINIIEVGINLGIETLTCDAGYPKGFDSTGAAEVLATTYGTTAPLNVTAPVLGLAGRVRILKAETKTVMTDIGIIAGLNWVQFPDVAAFGSQELLGKTPIKNIDPVSSYNNLQLMVNASIWF